MVSVQINLLFGLCIDLILWNLIVMSLFVDFFSYERYTVTLSGISSEWKINSQNTQAYLDFTDFEDVECGNETESPQELCENIPGLKLAGLSYQSLSILSLISLTLSVIHYIMLISLRVRTLVALEYFHILNMPLYFISTGLYIFLSSFYDMHKAKAQEGVIISQVASGIGVIELFYFLYIKKYKDWRLELLTYQTIEESNRYNLPRTHEDLPYSQAPSTDRTKTEDIGKLYYDLMEKYESEVTLIQVNEKKAIIRELTLYQQEAEKHRGISKSHSGEIRSIEYEKELIDLHKKLKESNETVALLDKELIQHRKHPLKELYSNNLDTIRQKDQEISEAYALVSRLQEDREKLIHEIDALKAEQDVEELCLSYENSLKEKDVQLEEKEKTVAEKEQQLDDKDRELEEKEKEIEYLVQIHKEFEETLGSYRSKAAEYETAIQSYRNNIEEQEVSVKEKEFENNALYNQLERAVNDKEDLQIQIRNLKNSLNVEKEKLEEEVNKYEEIVEEKDQEIEVLNEEIEEKDREILRLHDEIDNMLRNMVDHANSTDRSYRTIEDQNQTDYSFIKTDHEEEFGSLSKDEFISQDSHVLEEFSEENEERKDTQGDLETEVKSENEHSEPEVTPDNEHSEIEEKSDDEHSESEEKSDKEHSEAEEKSDYEHSEPEEKSDKEHSEDEEKSDKEHFNSKEKQETEHSDQQKKPETEHLVPKEKPETEPFVPKEKPDMEHLDSGEKSSSESENLAQREENHHSEGEEQLKAENSEPEQVSHSKVIEVSDETDLKDQMQVKHLDSLHLPKSIQDEIEGFNIKNM